MESTTWVAADGVDPSPERNSGQAFAIARGLTDAHVQVLVNRGARVDVRDRTMWIAGCDSAWGGSADMAATMHTHGGQVRLPLTGAPYSHRVDERIQIASG